MTKSPAKRLSELTRDLTSVREQSAGDPKIVSIAYDSRQVTPGSLFVAMRGLKADGASFVHDAILRGAAAIVAESRPQDIGSVPFVQVGDSRKSLAELAWAFFGHPERSLTLTGITGTNGKTTTAMLLRQVLENGGKRAGVVGTLGAFYGNTSVESFRTTPESVDLAGHFAAMRDQGIEHAVMEVTSIGVDLERTWGLPFRVAVFTNLTRDHLDYHVTEEAYRDAKLRFFREQDSASVAVINADDPSAIFFLEAARGEVVTYSIDADSAIQARNLRLTRQGIQFQLQIRGKSEVVEAPLIGRFNVYNLLAVIAAADALGVPFDSIRTGLRSASPVRGRAEIVPSSAPFTVVVDYAHTPDALEKILATLKDLEHHRIVTVVGAGGDRDKGKRPQMAATASRFSDTLYLTSDNPRSEDPEAILNDMAAGLSSHQSFNRNADRRATIETALKAAGAGDIVLIAGKGHETYQEIAGVKHPFDDRAVALECLLRLGYGS